MFRIIARIPTAPARTSSMPNSAESVRNGRLAPAEEALDVGEVECHIGRAAVIALAAVGGGLHLAQQRVHLGGREAPPGAHAGVAGERAAHSLDALLQGERIA